MLHLQLADSRKREMDVTVVLKAAMIAYTEREQWRSNE